LRKNPNKLPVTSTSRVDRVVQLQMEVDEATENRDKVEEDLKKQLKLLQSRCDELEENFGEELEQAIMSQQTVNEDMKKKLDITSTADQLQQQTIPWHYFMHELDQLASADKDATLQTSGGKNTALSRGAIALTDRSAGCPSDVQLRSYQIDHALLTNHVKMLSKEVERYEKMGLSQELAGKFLSEHNVWNILSKSDASIVLANSTMGEPEGALLASLSENPECIPYGP
jgi:hypothetical protein